jgi:hypothetical protein
VSAVKYLIESNNCDTVIKYFNFFLMSHSFLQRNVASLMSTLIIVTQLLTPLSFFTSQAHAAPTLSIVKSLAPGTPNPIQTGQEFDYNISW